MASGTTSSGAGAHPNAPRFRLLRARDDLENRFTIEREVEGGGMAEVLIAWDNLLERPVVLKRMRPELRHESGLLRMCVEAICLARLHRVADVLTIYDASFGEPLRP